MFGGVAAISVAGAGCCRLRISMATVVAQTKQAVARDVRWVLATTGELAAKVADYGW